MSKFSSERIVRYVVDDKGFLYLNKGKFIYAIGDRIRDELKEDKIFDRFTESEIDEFFSLLVYLHQNFITYAYREAALGRIEFSYGAKRSQSKENVRSIIFFRNFSDTTSFHFTRYYEVLDLEEKLLLVRLK